MIDAAAAFPAWRDTSLTKRAQILFNFVDGRNVSATGGQDGFWFGPTLIDHVTPEMSVYTDEISGPVLSIVRVESYDEALELINSNPYGNGTAIFTSRSTLPERGRGRHDRHQRAHPRADGLLQLWRLEGLAVRRHPCSRHRGRALLHPRQGITSRWLDPSRGGIELGFPQNT